MVMGQRQVVAALCAAMTWSLFATPAAAMNAALRFGAPAKISRMSFDATDYPAAFFEASHFLQLESAIGATARTSQRSCDLRSVAAIKCALVTDEASSECEERTAMRLRGGGYHRTPAWKGGSLHQRIPGDSALRR
mmetsp:Transcript_42470/g.101036  ORF Transcript_42470/g.101036 Transcript_42470/m.101036 type:complete len:136 (-) Transcript_42470:65-472(-)